MTGRDHHRPGREPLARRGAQHPADAVAVVGLGRVDALHFGAPADLELVPGPVTLQVVDDGVAGGPAARRPGNPEAGQPGQAAHGVQMQPVVARAPAGPDLLTAFQDDRAQPPAAQFGGGRQPGRAAADDVDLPRLAHVHNPCPPFARAARLHRRAACCPILPDARDTSSPLPSHSSARAIDNFREAIRPGGGRAASPPDL